MNSLDISVETKEDVRLSIRRDQLRRLNDLQYLQIFKQIEHHSYEEKTLPVSLDGLDTFFLNMKMGVLEPMSSLLLAQYILSNPDLFVGQSFCDIGTGSGIQAICAKLTGSPDVVASDISAHCINCARGNTESVISNAGIQLVQADLFNSPLLDRKFDNIVFAQPLFGDKPLDTYPVTRGMLDEGELIHRFLREAQDHLSDKGSIFMVEWPFAGSTNNPMVQIDKHPSLMAERVSSSQMSHSPQQGTMSVVRIIRK